MPIVIRPYVPADRDAAFHALSVVYGDGSPPEADDELPTERSHFVAMDGAICAGFFAEHHFDTLRGEAMLPTGGVAMVGVVPERRHTGVGRDLMRFGLNDMRRRGKVLASLYPFAESFYRQFGYEVCGARFKFEVAKGQLPKLGAELPIRRLDCSRFDEIKPCYAAFARSRSGLVDRSDYFWDRLFGRKAKSPTAAYEKTVYAIGDPVEAYAVVAHSVAFHVEQAVAEFVWSTPRGYETLHAFVRSLAANKSGLTWYEPSDSPFYFRYQSSSALGSAKLDRLIMYRVLHVPAALSLLKSAMDVEFTLRVTDPDLPENTGPWRVQAKAGQVLVSPCEVADLDFDIRSFTQAFLGQPSIDDVVRNGFVAVHSPTSVDAFRALMPSRPVYCLDMF